MKKYKMYAVLVDLNKDVSYNHGLYCGEDFEKALNVYKANKNVFTEIMLVSYANEEDYELGYFKVIYEKVGK